MKLDPLITGIILALISGLLIPISDEASAVVSTLGDFSVAAVFLVYGMRLATREVLRGLVNIRLQGAILATTFVFFPLVGLLVSWLTANAVGQTFALGILYLALLPSTIQSSVTFVSIARGNVGAAIAAATISNIVGIFLTPLLVLWLMHIDGGNTGGFGSVLVKLLLPFVIGQALQPLVGNWIRGHKPLTRIVDVGAIIIVVFSAVVEATNAGAWSTVTPWTLLILVGVLALILVLFLCLTWFGGKALKISREDRIVLLMCGSKKSLATGLPMAKALFAPAVVGALAIPLIIFHQMQLMVCASISRSLNRAPK